MYWCILVCRVRYSATLHIDNRIDCRHASFFCQRGVKSKFSHLFGFRPLHSTNELVANLISGVKICEAVLADVRVMNEYVSLTIDRLIIDDEPVPFFVVEPLYFAGVLHLYHHYCFRNVFLTNSRKNIA